MSAEYKETYQILPTLIVSSRKLGNRKASSILCSLTPA
jgi:hypothetical protein